jgi:nucleotide-binding universal stress UspA family protein
MEIKKVLFGTDFTEGSNNALPYAVDIARRYGAKLYLVHVIYDIERSAGWYVPHRPLDEIYDDMEKSALKQLEKSFIDEMRGFSDIEHVVLRGVPYEEIAKFAEENKIDIIVVGTYGRTGMDRLLFGSTAEQVVRSAPCPVLTVRIPRR